MEITKQYCNIPLKLVKMACDDLWEDTLAYYAMIKGIKENPRFEGYNSRLIGNALDVSHTCINKHINILIQKDLAYKKGRTLIFRGVNQLCERLRTRPIKYCIRKTKTENVNEIRNIRIIRQLHAQSYHINKCEQIIANCSNPNGKVSKSDLAYIKKKSPTGEIQGLILALNNHNGLTWLSNKQFGAFFGLRKGSGYLIQRRMKNEELIKSIPHYLVLSEAEALKIGNNYALQNLLSSIEDGEESSRAFINFFYPSKRKLSFYKKQLEDGFITNEEYQRLRLPQKQLNIRLANTVVPMKYSFYNREITKLNPNPSIINEDDYSYDKYIKELRENEYFNNNSKNRDRDIIQYKRIQEVTQTSVIVRNNISITKKFTKEFLNGRTNIIPFLGLEGKKLDKLKFLSM